MAEYSDTSDADRVYIDPEAEELRRQEEGIYMAAKAGALFMPKMTRRDWAAFCRAATIEEHERRMGIPPSQSQLRRKDRAALDKVQNLKSPKVRRMLKRREELITTQRPQCVDPNDEDFEDAILQELGMTAEEFSQVDKSTGGAIPDWDEIEAENRPSEEDEEYY